MDTMANKATVPGTSRPTAEAILAAAGRVIVRRGADATRIADIAAEAGTSTGTVHYYFETKEDVLIAALKWANERPYDRIDELLGHEADDLARLGTLLELSIPYPGPAREEWVFFLELWGWILHRPEPDRGRRHHRLALARLLRRDRAFRDGERRLPAGRAS